jgi:hypothetical protein
MLMPLFSTCKLILASKINAAEEAKTNLLFFKFKMPSFSSSKYYLLKQPLFFGTNKTVLSILLLLIYFAPQHYKRQ